MPVEDWALVACVVIAGLWSGLLAMLTTILHPILKGMDAAGFTRFLDAFLPIAPPGPGWRCSPPRWPCASRPIVPPPAIKGTLTPDYG
jgi:hypothetical protein